jgi:hypothetical protein
MDERMSAARRTAWVFNGSSSAVMITTGRSKFLLRPKHGKALPITARTKFIPESGKVELVGGTDQGTCFHGHPGIPKGVSGITGVGIQDRTKLCPHCDGRGRVPEAEVSAE